VTDPAAARSSAWARGRVGHDALVVTACTMLSRVTGFARVLVAAAVLGNGVLGDTYHAANLVPNLLFELVAAGSLQAVLVPAFVAADREGGDEGLGRAVAAVAGVGAAGLAAIAVIGMALSPVIAWVLTAAEPDPQVATDKRSLVTAMLVVFLPQIVFYGIGMVSTAALAARRRFVAAALAPAVNNVVVISCYLAYRATRPGELAALDLDALQFALLAGGTTAAVIAFTAVPAIVLTRSGVRWRPRWELTHPAVRGLRSSFGWATLSVVGTLLPTAAAVLLGFGATGGVAVFAMTFAFFVLPHALVAVPIATAIAPRVADAWQRADRASARELVERATLTLLPLLALASAGLVGLSWPIARLAAGFGQASSQGFEPVAHTLAVFGLGLIGYGVSFTMLRVLFSVDQVRSAALLVVAGSVLGVVSMAAASAALDDSQRSAAMAFGFGVSQVVSAVLLTRAAAVTVGAPKRRSTLPLLGMVLVAGAVAASLMWWIQDRFGTSQWASAAALVVSGASGIAAFAAIVGVVAPRLTGVPLRSMVYGLRGRS
jgi:putative peptidoglycan lipid II flippase